MQKVHRRTQKEEPAAAIKQNINTKSFKLQKRIGSTVYLTNVYFKNDTAETIDDKIIRLIKNDLNFASKNVTMAALHTGGLPERSSA